MSQRAVVDVDQFTYDWEGGVPTATMATTYGISDSTVSKVARRLGLPSRRSEKAQATTHRRYALTGGRWVSNGRVQVWQPGR